MPSSTTPLFHTRDIWEVRHGSMFAIKYVTGLKASYYKIIIWRKRGPRVILHVPTVLSMSICDQIKNMIEMK